VSAVAQPLDAARLVAALRGATDPLARLRLVAGAARSLATVPAERRRRLLAAIGMAEAEVLVDRVVDDEGARGALQRALEALQADPQRARTLVRDLANPSTRGRTMAGLLAFLEESLGAAPAEAPAEVEPVDEPGRIVAESPSAAEAGGGDRRGRGLDRGGGGGRPPCLDPAQPGAAARPGGGTLAPRRASGDRQRASADRRADPRGLAIGFRGDGRRRRSA
jgi:hypothetical protein